MLVKNLTPFAFGTKVCSRRPPQPEMALIVRGRFQLRNGERRAIYWANLSSFRTGALSVSQTVFPS